MLKLSFASTDVAIVFLELCHVQLMHRFAFLQTSALVPSGFTVMLDLKSASSHDHRIAARRYLEKMQAIAVKDQRLMSVVDIHCNGLLPFSNPRPVLI